MKKLKKVWMLALLAVGFALVFSGCSDTKDETETEQGGGAGSGDETGGNGGGQTSGTEKPSDPAGDDKVVTVFDPATYNGEVGEVVEKDGVKYLKVTPDGFKTTIGISPAVNLKGKTKFKCTMFGEKASDDYQFTVKLSDNESLKTGDGKDANGEISSIAMYGIVASPTEKEAGVAEKQSWNAISETMVCEYIQPAVQERKDNYPAVSTVTVYIGKITAE